MRGLTRSVCACGKTTLCRAIEGIQIEYSAWFSSARHLRLDSFEVCLTENWAVPNFVTNNALEVLSYGETLNNTLSVLTPLTTINILGSNDTTKLGVFKHGEAPSRTYASTAKDHRFWGLLTF